MPVKGFFTKENAKAYGQKGIESRARQIQQLRNALSYAQPPPSESLAFTAKRLARVRVQLDRIDREIEESSLHDARRIRELCDAQVRLSEQERILAGRPLPGSQRYPTIKPGRTRLPAAMMDEHPTSGTILEDSPGCSTCAPSPREPGWEYDAPSVAPPSGSPASPGQQTPQDGPVAPQPGGVA